jgi:hypothetical protein
VTVLERSKPATRRPNEHQALAALALLAVANPQIAEQLLRDPVGAAQAHPHYSILLDDNDRRVLTSIQAHARSLSDFLQRLADAIDDGR